MMCRVACLGFSILAACAPMARAQDQELDTAQNEAITGLTSALDLQKK